MQQNAAKTDERAGAAGASRRLVVASNRLPISLHAGEHGLEVHPSSGGLVAALAGFAGEADFVWVGWPGATVAAAQRAHVVELLAKQGLVPVFLTREQESHYYRSMCNEALWPLFHYFQERVAFNTESWDHYVAVNRMIADAVLEQVQPGTRVWVHDFHLMLVPRILREARPDLQIGFFLHIPFPSSEIYRLLPVRAECLLGILGSDYIGFHTEDYARHFRTTCLRVLGLDSEPNSIPHEGRRVGIGANPIGIDIEGFRRTLQQPDTADMMRDIQERYRGRKLVLGVERLDYTKGIPLKLRAFNRFLERDPERASEVTLLQVIVPSRSTVPDYERLQREIEQMVGRINGKYARPGITPIEYLHRNLSAPELVALYRCAHACVVTPLRDGMNLVAQEFALCQAEDGPGPRANGALVLSEFTGAAQRLARALLVNPLDIEQTASALEEALAMSQEEKEERAGTALDRAAELDCRSWATGFLERLDAAAARNSARPDHRFIGREEVAAIQRAFAAAPKRVLVLDYDGTLREITRRPEEARPTREITDLLRRLGMLPATEVHLVSGRRRSTMGAWFGDLPVYLCAEHGFAWRAPGGDWHARNDVDLSWLPAVRELLLRVSDEVPGTQVEMKAASAVWHYRMADLDYGAWRARELANMLEQQLANQPAQVVHGHRAIEVRASAANKGTYVQSLVAAAPSSTFFLCIGDDRTDLDMYGILPPDGFAIHVGAAAENARYTVTSPARVRGLLAALGEQID
jgi:trehalose 6-phosphate synthase/phosphatase